MRQRATLSFAVQPFEGTFSVTPMVNASLLSQLASVFEVEHHFEPAGGYGGLIPSWFNYGDLHSYFLGGSQPESYFGKMGSIYILGCECGEVGCWPLVCRVHKSTDEVIWDSFQQPHRPERDYSKFGPFLFERQQYHDALSALNRKLVESRSDEI